MTEHLSKTDFLHPPLPENEEGEIRKVGFEFEFAGLTMDKVVEIVAGTFQGQVVPGENSFTQKISTEKFGDFTVELDARFLKEKVYQEYLSELGIDIDRYIKQDSFEKLLRDAAEIFVPMEVVTPPIPCNTLGVLDELRQALHVKRARGTGESFFYAFGLHINPEVPSLEAGSLLRYLQAFLILYEWLLVESDIDLSRRISPYINPFSDAYIRLVLDSGYRPDGDSLIRDYLRFNPTRNRPLDFMPVFAMLDEQLILAQAAEKELIKKRPAFHYRLPNCQIDQSDWSIAREWNNWVKVEQLAEDKEKLAALAAEYLKTKESFWDNSVGKWLENIRNFLQ